MIVLRFQKYGTLWSYNGIPVYVGNKLVTKRRMCWWWPVNWVALLIVAPVIAWRVVRKQQGGTRE